MPKKKSSVSKKSTVTEEMPSEKQQKSLTKPGKLGKEIDEIFGDRKRKKPELQKAEETKSSADSNGGLSENPLKKRQKKTKKTGAEKNRHEEDTSGRFREPIIKRSRKKTEDGLVVYTEEELGFNKSNAGGTSLCPFDCDCCF